MDKDLLGFRCEFVPGCCFPKYRQAARCRPAKREDLHRCPGSEQCSKPEACRVRQMNNIKKDY
ncbi:MAG: hypothetical protein ACR2PX_01135 [Endozoicomonas sp.]|uniref:hypothetical protein n=1 Tax=Endozoicomonas sp. TaxID=1892382 RepID=UPI003D9B94CA